MAIAYRRPTRASADRRRAEWARDVDRLVRSINPRMSGRIDWDTATYLFRAGRAPAEAAQALAGGVAC